jgi:hypothetical protein
MSSRANHGGVSSPGSHMRDAVQSRNSIPMPSGSIASPVAPLKPFNLTQAMIDGIAVSLDFSSSLLCSEASRSLSVS